MANVFFSRVEHEQRSLHEATAERVADARSAIVVGGGLAGLAAATVLAERGVSVTVLERERFAGGRAGAWTDAHQGGEPFEMERGFHAFFRQYYNLRALLRRIDPLLSNLVPLSDYPLLGPGGRSESFANLPATPPFNVAALVRRTPRIALRDLLRAEAANALEMLAYDQERTERLFGSVSAREYLDGLRLPDDARHMLFDVFAHSFFNPEDRFSAADLLMMFHFYFTGNPEGLVFDVLAEPFSTALFTPLLRYLGGLGVRVVLGTSVSRVEPVEGGGFLAFTAGQDAPLPADALVLAVDVPGLKRIVAASPALTDATFRKSVDALDVTLPFAVHRLWFDRTVDPNRPAFAGTTGLGIIDNISVYERFEGESRRWSLQQGGSVVELHAYAVPEALDEADIRRELLAGLHAAYPETRALRILEERFLLRRDCPAFPLGGRAGRPVVSTPYEGLALSGDYVELPFPSALMERAVTSGIMAANLVMARWNVRPERVFSVPPRGILAPLLA